MKMVMVVYNEAIESDVMEAVGELGLKNYTKIVSVFGSGTTSGTHLGDDIWPGKNNVLYIACEDRKAKETLTAVRGLRGKLGKEGIKAFVLPVEDIT